MQGVSECDCPLDCYILYHRIRERINVANVAKFYDNCYV